jgi:hypothetical protein
MRCIEGNAKFFVKFAESRVTAIEVKSRTKEEKKLESTIRKNSSGNHYGGAAFVICGSTYRSCG